MLCACRAQCIYQKPIMMQCQCDGERKREKKRVLMQIHIIIINLDHLSFIETIFFPFLFVLFSPAHASFFSTNQCNKKRYTQHHHHLRHTTTTATITFVAKECVWAIVCESMFFWKLIINWMLSNFSFFAITSTLCPFKLSLYATKKYAQNSYFSYCFR